MIILLGETINWSLIVPLLIIQIILMLIALFDWIKYKETNGPRWLWAIIIIFVSTIGPILYFIVGRKDR